MKAGIPVIRINRQQGERMMSVESLVQDINRCKVMLALPAYSHSFTTRPTECMACGVPIVVPYLADFARCNEAQWEHQPHYYQENDIDSLLAAISTARQDDPQAILREARERHALEIRLKRIIETVKP